MWMCLWERGRDTYRNPTRPIWEVFLEEWPRLPIRLWSETKILPYTESPSLSPKSHIPPQSPSRAEMCSLEYSSSNYALLL